MPVRGMSGRAAISALGLLARSICRISIASAWWPMAGPHAGKHHQMEALREPLYQAQAPTRQISSSAATPSLTRAEFFSCSRPQAPATLSETLAGSPLKRQRRLGVRLEYGRSSASIRRAKFCHGR
jgi:hypothetical protein